MKILGRNKYISVEQHDESDCGPACLLTIAKYYGLNISLAKIRDYCGTDMEGTTVYGMISAAKKINLKSKVIKTDDYDDIFGEFPKPCIAHVVKKGVLHYVVIYKVTDGKILASDPAEGLVTYTPKEFFEIWSGIMLLFIPSEKFEKVDNEKNIFNRFFSVLLSQKILFLKIFLASIIITLLGVLGAFYFQILVDDIIPNGLEDGLNTLSIAMICLIVIKCITDYLRNVLMLKLGKNIDISILLGYYKHIVQLPMNFFDTRKVGEITSRFGDGSNIRQALSNVTLTLMMDSLMTLGGGFILYRQSSLLFFICFIPVVIYLSLVSIFKKPIERSNRNLMENNAKLNSYLIESIEGAETVKAFNGEERVFKETEKRFISFIDSMIKMSKVVAFQELIKGSVQAIFPMIIGWVGGFLIFKGEMSIGELISFNTLLAYFIGPIERIINLQSTLQSAIVAADRLGEILDLDRECDFTSNKDNIRPESLYGDINYENIDFRYGCKKKVISNISLKINAGESVALVGESGSGKTTIVKLLMNFYQYENGKITVNGYDLKHIDNKYLREKIAYISQQTFFFYGTIKENLLFSNPNATDSQIVEACKKARINEYIEGLPLKYDTLLHENAMNLSGGQRQRLAIARALIKKPEILIMDEATSNLDVITEKAIQDTISECTKNITTIIIAHRLSTILQCNKVFVISNGHVVEEGKHMDLIKKRGLYYQLWSKQSDNNLVMQ